MYSFAQRSDTQVYDEPLYGHYLKCTNADEYHPGSAEIMKSMNCNGQEVIDEMLKHDEKPVQFFKNMGHHLLDLDKAFTKNGFNIILTRDPKRMIASFSKVIQHPSMKDIGYEDQLKLAIYFKANAIPFIVVDSKDILIDPKTELTAICNFIGIPFESQMLHWKQGPRKEDGVWAKYWYGNVHNSEGFLEYKENNIDLPTNQNSLYKDALNNYNSLLKL
jgi:hypothetical protein